MGIIGERSKTPITDRLLAKSNLTNEVTPAKRLAVSLGKPRYGKAKELTPRAVKDGSGFSKGLAKALREGLLSLKQVQDIVAGRKS